MGQPVKTAIVIPVHGAKPYVERTLQAIDSHWLSSHPLVIVDDCSDTETAEFLRHHIRHYEGCRPASYLCNERQQLFTRTVNRGLRFAYQEWQPEFIAVVNSDVDLKPFWLSNLVNALLQDATLGLIGYPDSPDGKKPLVRKVKYPEYVTGHCLLLRVKMLEEIGIFCESDTDGRQSPELAPYHGLAHIGSDRVLSWNANAHGWGTAYCNFEGLTHAAGKSWNHDLSWLQNLRVNLLWEPKDTIQEPRWYGEDEVHIV